MNETGFLWCTLGMFVLGIAGCVLNNPWTVAVSVLYFLTVIALRVSP